VAVSRARPYVLVGNPENRRVMLFQQALVAQGREEATVVPWRELVDAPERLADLPPTPALVRIDSAGESFDVERALLALGYDEAQAAGVSTIDRGALAELQPDRGRILCPRQHHLGFLRLLARLEEIFAARPDWRVLSSTRAIADLFDKRVTSRRYAAAEIPVPPFLDGVSRPDELREAMRERGWSSVFVKLSCGSSASCLGVYRLDHGGESFMTTIEQASTGWYNNLRLRRVSERRRIDELIGFLLREGSQLELAVPKARLDGAFFDCRVLVVAGEPAFVVARQNQHPITNLHLGGWRGKPESLEAQVPAALRAAAMDSCRRVAASHDVLQIGVDLLYEAGWRGHRVLEANAFGDLLPNLTRDGLSVYEWEIREATRLYG
jgi:hypothetical protein